MSQSHTLLTATSSAPGPAASSRALHCSPPTPGQALIHGFHRGISILVQSGIWVTLAWGALGAWASLAAVGKIDGIGLATADHIVKLAITAYIQACGGKQGRP